MKSISRVLSMFLVVVMCFGLFSTSAFATSLANFDFSGGSNAAENNNAGGGFNFNPTGSSNSASNGSGFDFGGQQSQPVNFDPQPATTTTNTTNTTNTTSGNAATTTNSLSTGSTPILGALPGTSWVFHSKPLEITKATPASDATVTIWTEPAQDFNSDSFPGGFGYSTKSNGEDITLLTQGVHYSITKNNLLIFGDFVKTLPVGLYYFFGLNPSQVPKEIGHITINSGDFGQFNIGNSPYNKNADNPPASEIFADSTSSKMGLFSGFGIVGVSDPSFTKTLALNTEYTVTSNNRYVYIKADVLNNLADGTYTLVGFATSSNLNTDQVVIGNFVIESGALGVSYAVDTASSGYYDKSKPQGSDNFVSFRPEDTDSVSEQWLFKFTYKVTSTSGSYSRALQQGVDYTIEKFGNARYTLALTGAGLNALPDGQYNLVGTATVGSSTVETVLGTFTVVTSGVNIADFTMHANAYDKSKSDRAEVYAQTEDADTARLMPKASYSISGPVAKALSDAEYYVDYANGLVALKIAFLDTLPDGTYTLSAVFTSGVITVQKTLGTFTVSSGPVDYGTFTIENSPYDKNKDDRKAIAVKPAADWVYDSLRTTLQSCTVTGPSGAKTLTNSDYVFESGALKIRKAFLDSLADGTYNFTGTASVSAATIEVPFGSFIVTSGAVSLGNFTMGNTPYDKNNDDRKAVYALPEDASILPKLETLSYTLTGTLSKTLAANETVVEEGRLKIRKAVLDTLPDGSYTLNATVTSGLTTTQVKIGDFVITTGTIDAGQFLIKGSPYDKDADHDDPAAVSATALTAGMMGKLSDFAISGVGSINPPRKLGVGEYHTDLANDVFAIDNSVLDGLDDGSYYIVATVTMGVSSKQVTLGTFNVTSGGIDYGFQIHYSPYDKNKADHTAIVATANNKEGSKAKGIMARMSSFAIATGGTFSTGTYANIQTLSPSDYTIDSANNGITIHNNVLDALEDGNYILLGSLTTGNVTQQLTIGGFTIISGVVDFGTTFIFQNIYDKNDKDRKAVYGGVKGAFDARLKLSDFEITGVSDSSFSQALSVNQYTYTDGTEKKIELSKDVLDALSDGIYNLMCTATIGNVSKSISLGSFTVKSGNVKYGTPHIGNPLFDKNDEKRQIVYAWVTDADERFEMGNFVISGITYPSINQTLSGSQYSMEGKTKVNISMDVLDALPDGDYNFLCTAKVGNAKIQMTLGMFTVISGKIDYGTYIIYGSPYDKNANPAPEFYAQATAIDKMTKMTGFAITGITNPTFNRVLSGSEYARNDWSVTISESVLDSLPDGDYNLIGFATVLKNSAQVNMGKFTVVSNYGNFEVFNSPYDKNDKHAQAVFVTAEKKADMQKMTGFGVAAVNGSYVQALSVNNYYRSSDGYSVVLEESYLDTLADGQYYLIGFPTYGSTAEQVILGTFIIRSGGIEGNALLTPDGQVWYGGSDPLTFYSEIHDLAGKGWNYKPYDWGNIVPDIRVSTYSDMRSPTSVRIDQYWDLNYGYIMLGTNFLNSLSAEHTYYMQVIDARDPEGLYSNVVSFRVGPTLRALDTDKHVINSTRSLRFRSSEPVARVYVGNIELTDPADFGISWDGRTVTLSFEFLNKRTGGNTYTIKVLTTGGEYASTTFQVLTTAQGSASPRTGDESNLGLWAAFLLLSGTAIVVMVPKLKKHDF